MLTDEKALVQKKVKQIFSWLKAYHQTKSPPKTLVEDQLWHLWLRNLPGHPSIHPLFGDEDRSSYQGDGPDGEWFLAVGRASIQPPPPPPEALLPWLEEGWDEPSRQVHMRKQPLQDGDPVSAEAPLLDEEEKAGLFESWRKKREEWAEKERPAREARKIFEDFYRLYSDMEREGEAVELLLGDGILRWTIEGCDISHPILLKRVQIKFDAKKPEFRLLETDEEVELYTALFSRIPGLPPSFLKNVREGFEQGEYHPFDAEPTSDFLNGLVHQLSSRGEFYGENSALRASSGVSLNPTIFRDPILFLRKRDLKYAQAIEGILENLENQGDTPPAFWRFVGVEPEASQGEGGGEPHGRSPWSGFEEVIFTKPWNAEQLDILKRLQRHSTALVQGPPGTGKTHTIGNLIGHFLAHGQSVLVTAHTSKALRVLKGKVIPDLQPLCVSVLEDELESRRQLESSVEMIVEHLSSDEPEALESKAQKTQARRREILGELSSAWQELKEVRAIECRDVVGLWGSLKPLEAAKKVHEGKDRHAWIPDGLPRDVPCPLETAEILDLYALSAMLTPEEEKTVGQLHGYLKDSDSGFKAFLAEDPLGVFPPPQAVSLWTREPRDAEPLQRLIARMDKGISWVGDFQRRGSWSLGVLEAVLGDEGQGGVQKLLEMIEGFIEASSSLGGGGVLSFGFLKKRRLDKSRRCLTLAWEKLLEPHGLPRCGDFLDQGELRLQYLRNHLQEALSWWDQEWEPLQSELRACCFDWRACLRKQPLELSPTQRLLGALDEIRQEFLTRCDMLERAKGLFEDLLQKKTRLERKEGLLSRLEPVAPEWARRIRDRQGVHASQEPPGDPKEAWLCGQLKTALKERSQVRQGELQGKIERLQAELRVANAEFASLRAWSAQVRKTSHAQRQALVGWLDTVRRIGKGTGKRAPGLRKEARKKMEECRQAVPVWIMPVARVVEAFDPRHTRFDVVIVDEASQCDLLGLCALFMARKAIIVGDHEQVSPLAIGSEAEVDRRLIDEHLGGIPNKDLYDGRFSVYDLARQSFSAAIRLLEHFRCVSDIVAFSNHLCYQGRIKPLRDSSGVKTRPFVIPYRVEGAFRQGKVNPKEAEVIASLIMAAIEQPEYQEAEFGVISLVRDDQALLIDSLLRRYLPPETYRARRILCGNPAQFQGDERTVMFLSMVDVPEEGPLSLKTQDRDRQRFNVAASRACDQMWVVYSLDPKQDLKPGDLRRRLIEHALDPMAVQKEFCTMEEHSESEFEKEVAIRLLGRGYHLHPQWQVGAYRIDLVAVDRNGEKVAIECDGDRYHTHEALEEDMARQLILERLGWRFIRIRGSAFYQDPEKTIDEVDKQLQRLGIIPFVSLENQGAVETSRGDELKDRILQRAAEIRANGTDGAFDKPQITLNGGEVDHRETEDRLATLNDEEPSPHGPHSESHRVPRAKKTVDEGVFRIKDNEEKASTRGKKPYHGSAAPSRLQSVNPAHGSKLKKASDPLIEALERLIPTRFCPECKGGSRVYVGRKGPFSACSNPSCKQTVSIPQAILQQVLEILEVTCPSCQAPMKAAFGKAGPFVGCTHYPRCNNPMSWKDLCFLLRERAKARDLETEYRP